MTWSDTSATFAVGLVLLFLPGYLVARGLGFARLQALGGAPALAMAAIGSASVIYHLAGIPWRQGTVVWGVVAATAVVLLMEAIWLYIAGRASGHLAARATAGQIASALWRYLAAPRPWGPVVGALMVAGGATAAGVMRGIGPVETPMQASDGLWHLNALAYVRAQADAYPIGSLAPMYWGEVHFYPTGWHAFAALLPGSVVTVTNVLVVVSLAAVWPLGCASLLSAVITPTRRSLMGALPLALSIIASATFMGPAMLTAMIWPYAWSIALLPGVLGMIMTARPRPPRGHYRLKRHVPSPTAGWCGAALACLGMVSVHGAAVFNLAVTAAPVLVFALLVGMAERWRRGGWHRLVVAALSAAVFLAFAVGAHAFRDQLLMLWSQRRSGGEPSAVFDEMLRDAPMVANVQVVGYGLTSMTYLAIAGAVIVFLRRRNRWAPLIALLAGTLMVSTVLSGTVLQSLTSAWYVQRARLDPLFELAVLVLVAMALEAARDATVAAWRWRQAVAAGTSPGIAEDCRRRSLAVRRRLQQSGLGRVALSVGSWLAGAVRLAWEHGGRSVWRWLCRVGHRLPGRVDIDLRRWGRRWASLGRAAWRKIPAPRLPSLAVAGTTLALVASCGAILVPATARVHAYEIVVGASFRPATSTWKLMLSKGEADFIRKVAKDLPSDAVIVGVPTNGSAYFWALTGHEVVYPTLRRYSDPDRLYVAAHASNVLFDPQVCQALRNLNADYLYTDSDITGGGAPGGGERPRFPTTLDNMPREAVEMVAHEKSWTLWKITYCALNDAEAAASGADAAEDVAKQQPAPSPTPTPAVSQEGQ